MSPFIIKRSYILSHLEDLNWALTPHCILN